MTPAPEQLLLKAKQWLEYADEDLRLAEHTLTMEHRCPYRLAAYHAQQCAEKHLKAYLVVRNVDFPFTHNLSLLLELCGNTAAWGTSLQDAEELSRFAIMTRYPGEDREVTRDQALRAVGIASRVGESVRDTLAREGFPR